MTWKKDQGRRVDRRSILRATGAAGVAGIVGLSTQVGAQEDAIEPETTIELKGETSGWVGIYPEEITDETNPTLSLVVGETYTVEWTNVDSQPHNFAIHDTDGEALVSTDIISEGSQTIEFTVTEEMVEYLCEPHAGTMVGDINLGEEPDPGPDPEPEPGDWTKEQLVEVDNAMKLEVAPDGRIFYTTRGADFGAEAEGVSEVGVIDPESEEVHTALELPVYTGDEDGLQGIALDPDFEDTGHVYLFYSPLEEDLEPDVGEPIRVPEVDGRRRAPPDHAEAKGSPSTQPAPPEHSQGEPPWLEEAVAVDPVIPEEYVTVGDPAYIQLSRFTMGDEYTIDPDSEVGVLKVPFQRESCCHVGGDIAFDSERNLYLTTGDDTSPFDTDGYAPIDEREGNEHIDAQRTSANTADLRGKVLRITPHENGGYSIPDGNLFPTGEYREEIEEGLVRPETYAMGLRNPFTLHVDQRNDDVLYVGDYGEGAATWSDELGAIGLVQHYRTREPQNFGWPYVSGPAYPYIDYDYETGEVGDPFDPENPVNDSPNNTGLEELPPIEPATLWYPLSWDNYLDVPDWVELAQDPDEVPWPGLPEGSGAPMTGPVYYHDEEFGDDAFPEAYDGKQLIADWLDNWFRFVDYDDDGDHEIEPALDDMEHASPMDMEFGPDGKLYLLEYGHGYDGLGGGVYRIGHDAE
jgi:glucose/arabinose dehydrogenase